MEKKMSRRLKIALVQQHASGDFGDNLARGVRAFEQAASAGARLIVFPELAFTYFYPQRPAGGDVLDLAEPIPGPTTETFSKLAEKWGVVVIVNLFERAGDKTYDSSPVINSDGTLLGTTRMVHICDAPCFHERGYYHPGEGSPLVFDTAVGRIGVAICYDRHYPEYMRVLSQLGAELVVVPQAGAVDEWPPGLFEAEMRVAGFHNGYFVALCNRVGEEDCVTFEGNSFVTAPDGRIIARAVTGEDAVLMAVVDLDEVKSSHARMHFLADLRPEIYRSWPVPGPDRS
jgi:N-carbamoylputrescine amidase